VQDLAGLLYARDVAATVAQRISYPGSPDQLLGHVKISGRVGQDFLAISGTAESPRLAARIANGYAAQLVTLTNNDQRRRILQAIQVTRQQLARTGNRPADVTTRQDLTAQIGRLQVAAQLPAADTRQVSPAEAPAVATSPRPVRDAVFAFVLSLALAVAIAFTLERFDRRTKTPEDLEHAYGLPLLAVVPHSPDPAPLVDGVVGLGPGFHEAFGLLRTNIQLLTLDAPLRSVVVVSAIPGEGKSTIARNLAVALCESGQRVVVVETDLRRPMQSGLFGLPAGPGLTEVLTGDATLSDVLQKVSARAPGIDVLTGTASPAPGGASSNGRSDADADLSDPTIAVLLAGSYPANPATALESGRVREVLDELRATHDVVILDSAPLLSVTDSVPLIRYADATLIVGRLGLTTRDNVRRMSDFLGRMPGIRLLGVVANDLTQLDAGGYGYAYDYRGYGGYRDDAVMRPEPKRGKRRDKPGKPAEHR
jgi:Mrp family chromosome partitioning ATPase